LTNSAWASAKGSVAWEDEAMAATAANSSSLKAWVWEFCVASDMNNVRKK
jgi:hypothetical protein